VDFEEVPGSDAGIDATPDAIRPDVGTDTGPRPDGATDASTDARDANPGFVTACNNKGDGKYCPGNRFEWPGDKDELVTCKGGKVTGTKLCDKGSGCIFMLTGYPDECDQCATKTVTGTYCGRDMPGWDPKNVNFRVRCQSGAQVGLVLCNGACTSNGASSTCPP